MPDQLKIIGSLNLAIIRSYGIVTKEDIRDSIIAVEALFHSGKINVVLVDATEQEYLPNVISLYNLSNELPFGVKIALFAHTDQITFENLQFFETTSHNKGKLLRLFRDKKEALMWLLGEEVFSGITSMDIFDQLEE